MRIGEARDLHRWWRQAAWAAPLFANAPPMEFIDFQARVFDVLMHIKGTLCDHLADADHPPLTGIEELRTVVRKATQDLMLATDMEAEMARLAREPRTLLCLYLMYEKMDILQMAAMLKTVQLSAPPTCDALPFYPFCAFMLEACERLTLSWQPRKKPRAKAKTTKRSRKAKES